MKFALLRKDYDLKSDFTFLDEVDNEVYQVFGLKPETCAMYVKEDSFNRFIMHVCIPDPIEGTYHITSCATDELKHDINEIKRNPFMWQELVFNACNDLQDRYLGVIAHAAAEEWGLFNERLYNKSNHRTVKQMMASVGYTDKQIKKHLKRYKWWTD